MLKTELTAHEEIALNIMKNVAYDNGWVNRWQPWKVNRYWLKKNAKFAGSFFDANPSLLTNEYLDLMCCGEESEVLDTFGHIHGYEKLSSAINGYFDRGHC